MLVDPLAEYNIFPHGTLTVLYQQLHGTPIGHSDIPIPVITIPWEHLSSFLERYYLLNNSLYQHWCLRFRSMPPNVPTALGPSVQMSPPSSKTSSYWSRSSVQFPTHSISLASPEPKDKKSKSEKVDTATIRAWCLGDTFLIVSWKCNWQPIEKKKCPGPHMSMIISSPQVVQDGLLWDMSSYVKVCFFLLYQDMMLISSVTNQLKSPMLQHR